MLVFLGLSRRSPYSGSPDDFRSYFAAYQFYIILRLYAGLTLYTSFAASKLQERYKLCSFSYQPDFSELNLWKFVPDDFICTKKAFICARVSRFSSQLECILILIEPMALECRLIDNKKNMLPDFQFSLFLTIP